MDTLSNNKTNFAIGSSTPRIEDERFIKGLGRFVDDLTFPDQAYMFVVRSPHAKAYIKSIDVSKAGSSEGVIAIFTGADVRNDGLGNLNTIVQRFRRDGSPMPRPPYPVLASDVVQYAGDPVAIVVATSLSLAQDAADLIKVTYETLDSVTDVLEATSSGAPSVWPQLAPDNVCFFYEEGDRKAVEAAFSKAYHISALDFRISRVSANPIEPRTAIGKFDRADGRYTLYASTQAPHKIRTELAEFTMRIPANQLRVISPDVGGGFGMKGSPYPEYALVMWAAKKIGRPVKWTASRTESFLSDFHARDNFTRVELALDQRGHFMALRVKGLGNLGAYLAFNTPHPSAGNLGGLAGVYRTPHIHAEIQGIFTNTQPNAPYRGAGRPEATYAIERIIDVAAQEMGIDRVELRKRNLISLQDMPFKTGLTYTYDSGDFAKNIELALEAADWSRFPLRKKASAANGKLRGISLVHPIEISGGPFRNPFEEGVEIRFDPNGDATLFLGSHNHGQGHETTFRQLASAFLGLDPQRTQILFGDTDLVVHGRGTFGSRSVMAVGTALFRASEKIIARGKMIASHLLEADENDIIFLDGSFTVAGTDKAICLEEIARASYIPGKLPPGSQYGLAEVVIMPPPEATFPNGCHICELEIDPETGEVSLLNYVVVDDVGTMINPRLVEGQIHGGVIQGTGQTLQEQIVYDSKNGQLLTGSFMDYSMPRAHHCPPIKVVSNANPTSKNPLGVKGAGEAGAVGALPAVINAIVDALAPFGISHIDMPATSEKIWLAIKNAKSKQPKQSTGLTESPHKVFSDYRLDPLSNSPSLMRRV